MNNFLQNVLRLVEEVEGNVIYNYPPETDFEKTLFELCSQIREEMPKSKKPRISKQEIERINFQWFVNQNNITAIGRMMKRAPGTCEKYLFKTRAEWEKWSKENLP